MRTRTWTSVAVGAVIGLLAVAGVAAVPSAPAQALSAACQIGNDTDVALQHAYGVTVAVSTIEMRACQSGKGSRVRIDYRIRNLDPQQPIFVNVTAPDGSVRQLQDRTVPGTADFAESQRWTTQATSSKGTWTLTVASLGANAILDSWKVWVIPGSCWRANYDDVNSAPAWTWQGWVPKPYGTSTWEYIYHPPTPAATSVSSACTERASADMRVQVQLKDVPLYTAGDAAVTLRLLRNGTEVPTSRLAQTVLSPAGDNYYNVEIWLLADGSQLMAAGTWTLEVTSHTSESQRGVTMDMWILHTSY